MHTVRSQQPSNHKTMGTHAPDDSSSARRMDGALKGWSASKSSSSAMDTEDDTVVGASDDSDSSSSGGMEMQGIAYSSGARPRV